MVDSLRRMRALMAGMVVAFAMSLILENVVFNTYPPPEDFMAGNPEHMAKYVANLADGGFALMIGGWALSAFVGAMIASLIGLKDLPRLAGVVTFAVLAGASTNFVMVSYPNWVIISTVFSVILAGLGAFALARRMGLERKDPPARKK